MNHTNKDMPIYTNILIKINVVINIVMVKIKFTNNKTYSLSRMTKYIKCYL